MIGRRGAPNDRMTDRNRRRILIVDDDALVVTSLKHLLGMERSHDVVTFTSCAEALAAIRQTPIHVGISDFLMPEMDGVTFLKHVRGLYPEAPLMILTGYGDKESAIRAINEVGLYQYLEKPWDNDDLLHVIDSALDDRLVIQKLQEHSRELEAKLKLLETELARLKVER